MPANATAHHDSSGVGKLSARHIHQETRDDIRGRIQLAHAILDVPGDAAEIAASNVAGHVDASGGTFSLDRVRGGDNRNFGHFAQGNMPAGRCFDQALPHGGKITANLRNAPYRDFG